MIVNQQLLYLVLICSLLGLFGQFLRLCLGLYKLVNDDANKGKPLKDLLDYRRMIISLILGFIVGAVISLIYSNPLSKADMLTIISIGYSGTDSIEGILQSASTLLKSKK